MTEEETNLGYLLFLVSPAHHNRANQIFGQVRLHRGQPSVLLEIGKSDSIGFTMSPASNLIMNSRPHNRTGIGSDMNDTTRHLGGALGVTIMGA